MIPAFAVLSIGARPLSILDHTQSFAGQFRKLAVRKSLEIGAQSCFVAACAGLVPKLNISSKLFLAPLFRLCLKFNGATLCLFVKK